MTTDSRAAGTEDAPVTGAALFERDGSRLVPTDHARGPWRPDALHGGAVAAVLANAVDVPERTPTRLTIDMLGPVPHVPLTVRVTRPEGGRRVVRQEITLLADGTPVARASCVAVRKSDVELPEGATDHPNPFGGVPVPELTTPTPGAREAVGYDCFDSGAIRVRRLDADRVPAGSAGLWIGLLLPVVAGEPMPPIARVAAAADYSSTATNMRLDQRKWSFMNTELTVHLSREPAGDWVGLMAAGVVQPVGAGLSVSTIYDAAGRLGQSAQALVIEARKNRT
ncbi:thioesterase family protein [Actinomadura sp. GC306]|uniref:thioesterase family protein n=1 Tax=Actinomadura sp. GC306 TaxID=2530367 RepID=UPI0014045833|nr:thioesterase family protein [Actinomadura sp. GC306]